MNRTTRQDCIIYARMSAADIRRARAQAGGDPEKLARLIAEKITSHLEECRRYAAGENWAVLAEYADNMISGSARYRRAGDVLTGRNAMLADLAERKGQRIIVLSTEVERLYRDVDESRELVALAKDTPITVISTDGEDYDLTSSNGEDRFNGAVSKGARESGKVSERRRRRERKRAEQGGYWGNEPFGFHKVYETDPDTGQRFYTGRLVLCSGTCCPAAGYAPDYWLSIRGAGSDVPPCTHHGDGCWLTPGRPFRPKQSFWDPDPDDWDTAGDDDDDAPHVPLGEADFILTYARAITRGVSLGSIRRDWDAIGLTTRGGERWTQQMIRRLFLNKRLNGIRVHRPGDKWGRADRKAEGIETRGQWPAILDDELFAAVRGVLMDPDRYKHLTPGPHRGAVAHLLAGLAECGNVLGAEFGVRDGRTCGSTMVGHPAPPLRDSGGNRLEDQAGRGRQYQCSKGHGGCGHCRRSCEIVDRHVIECIRAWTRPGGPYEEFVTAERAAHDASRAAVQAELAAIEAEKADLREQRERVNATMQRALRSGDLEPGGDMWKTFQGTFRDIDGQLAERAARSAKLMAATLPAPADKARADLELLDDPGTPVGVRADLVRRFVTRVIIRPAGQGARVFDPASVEVVPGPWADGLDPGILVMFPAGARPAQTGRQAVAAWLAEHPQSTPREVAEAIGKSHSHACILLARMRDAGEVVPDRPGRGGPDPIRYRLAG